MKVTVNFSGTKETPPIWVKTSPATSASTTHPVAGELQQQGLDYGLISDCLDETQTARGSVLGIDSNFILNQLKHFITQHCADTDFADEPHLN